MYKMSATLAASTAALIIALGAGQASAATATKTAKVRSPESIACSQQADAKGLHGKERKAFRATCKKQMAAAQTPAKPSPAPAPAAKNY